MAKQMETAALKAVSDNRSGPFARELTALYTRTTLLGPDVEGVAQGEVPILLEEEEGLYLLCLCEGREAGEKVRKDGKVTLGFLVSYCQRLRYYIVTLENFLCQRKKIVGPPNDEVKKITQNFL